MQRDAAKPYFLLREQRGNHKKIRGHKDGLVLFTLSFLFSYNLATRKFLNGDGGDSKNIWK
jgi:hypothetical protein